MQHRHNNIIDQENCLDCVNYWKAEYAKEQQVDVKKNVIWQKMQATSKQYSLAKAR